MAESARLEKEGKSPIDIIRATSHPAGGTEFEIRSSKFPGTRWSLRPGAPAVVDGKPGMPTYPAVPERTIEGWLELRFQQ